MIKYQLRRSKKRPKLCHLLMLRQVSNKKKSRVKLNKTLKNINRKKSKKLQSRLESVNLLAIRMTDQKYKTLNKISNKKQMMIMDNKNKYNYSHSRSHNHSCNQIILYKSYSLPPRRILYSEIAREKSTKMMLLSHNREDLICADSSRIYVRHQIYTSICCYLFHQDHII